ncbi:glyoxalase [Streptococcus pyogenes]|nr:glyoxalase [Streptococcus pyogenes]
MKLSAIHHVAIIVSDYNLSKNFYVNKLGFEIIREIIVLTSMITN